jgi:hypothetical protein
MPVNAALIIALVGLVLSIAVWFKTRRVGPVAGVLFGAFVVMAITDTTVITNGGQMVGKAITWFFDTVFSF